MKFLATYIYIVRFMTRLASTARRVSVFVASIGNSLKSTFEVLCGVGRCLQVQNSYFTTDGRLLQLPNSYFTTDRRLLQLPNSYFTTDGRLLQLQNSYFISNGRLLELQKPYFTRDLSFRQLGSSTNKARDVHRNSLIAYITSAGKDWQVWNDNLYLITIYSNLKINFNTSNL